MDIPVKYEDVVAKLDAALGREAALREELDLLKPTFESTFDAAQRDRAERDALQQRLTVAEQRAGELHKWVIKYRNVVATRRYSDNDEGDMQQRADRIELSRLDVALKPAAEGGCS